MFEASKFHEKQLQGQFEEVLTCILQLRRDAQYDEKCGAYEREGELGMEL